MQSYVGILIGLPIVCFGMGSKFFFAQDQFFKQPIFNIKKNAFSLWIKLFEIDRNEFTIGYPVDNFFHILGYYSIPKANLASSLISSCDHGGSKVSSNSTSLTPSIAFILSCTSCGKLSATGQLGVVNVITTFTS